MPLYAFACEGCGPFELLRPMAESSAAARCPRCGAAAARVFTAPAVRRLGAPVRRVLDMQDRSAHEPEVVKERRGRPLPHGHEPSPPWVLSH